MARQEATETVVRTPAVRHALDPSEDILLFDLTLLKLPSWGPHSYYTNLLRDKYHPSKPQKHGSLSRNATSQKKEGGGKLDMVAHTFNHSTQEAETGNLSDSEAILVYRAATQRSSASRTSKRKAMQLQRAVTMTSADKVAIKKWPYVWEVPRAE